MTKTRQTLSTALLALVLIANPESQAKDESADHFVFQVRDPDPLVNAVGGTVNLEGSVGRFDPKKFELRAYFPDDQTEVTSKLVRTDTASESRFRFVSGALRAGDANSLHLVLQSKGTSVMRELQELAAKFRIQIQAILDRIEGRGQPRSPPLERPGLLQLIKTLQELLAQVEDKIAQSSVVVAESRYALLVGNFAAAPSLNSTQSSGLRVALSLDVGAVPEGAITLGRAKITRSGVDHDGDNRQLFFRLFWNGAVAQEVGPVSLAPGASASLLASTGALTRAVGGLLELEVFESKKNKKDAELVVRHRLGEPIAEDTIPPHWLIGGTPDAAHPYVRDPQPLSLALQDDFGQLDTASVSVLVVGSLADGSSFSKNFSPLLQFSSPDQNRTLFISGDLNPLSDGRYTLTARARDVAGNFALPDPYSVSFTVDRTPPKIQLGVNDNVFTKSSAFALSVSVDDISPTTTQVYQNDQLVLETQDKSISVSAFLFTGNNTFEIRCSDAAGNAAAPALLRQIVLDAEAPIIRLTSQDHVLTSQPGFVVDYSVDDTSPIFTKILLNSERAFAGSANSVHETIVLREGLNQIRIEASDVAGNVANARELVDIRLDSTGPILSELSPKDGETISRLEISVSGRSDEKLSRVLANGSALDVSPDGLSFSGTVTAQQFGPFILNLEAFDLLQNHTQTTLLLVLSDTAGTGAAGDSQTDDESIDPSPGSVILGSVDPSVFNPVASTLQFQIQGAVLDPATANVELLVNNTAVSSDQFSVFASGISITGALVDGQNELELTAVDSSGLLLQYSGTLWAGSRSVSVVVLGPQGGQPQNATVTVAPADEPGIRAISNVVSGVASFSNLPNGNLVATAIDPQNRIALGRIQDGNDTAQVQLMTPGAPDAPDNTDFSQGLAGWKVFNGTPLISSHQEADQPYPGAFDLNLIPDLGSGAAVGRTVIVSSDAPYVWTRFQFTASAPGDFMVVMLRSRATGATAVASLRGADLGITSTGQEVRSGWQGLGLLTTTPGDTVDVVYRVRSVVVQTSFLEQLLMPPAYAAEVPQLTVQFTKMTGFFIKSGALFDYNIPAGQNTGTPGCTQEPLVGVSVGDIPDTYYIGTNRFCGRFDVAVGLDPYEVRVGFVQKGLSNTLTSLPNLFSPLTAGSLVPFTLPGTETTRAVVRFSEALDRLDAFANATRTVVSSGISTLERTPPFKLKKNLLLLVRYEDTRRYSGKSPEPPRNEDQGGDDWALPRFKRFLDHIATAVPAGISLEVGDISNMNGGRFSPHHSHDKGENADVTTGHYSGAIWNEDNLENRLERTSDPVRIKGAEDGLALLKAAGPTTEKIFAFFERKEQDAFWRRLRGECIPSGRSARALIQSEKGHFNHFHIKQNADSAEVTVPSIKPDFNYRVIKDEQGYVLEIENDTNAADASVWFLSDPNLKFIDSFDTDTAQKMDDQIFNCQRHPGAAGCIRLKNGPGFYFVSAVAFSGSGPTETCVRKSRLVYVPSTPLCKTKASEDPQFGRLHLNLDGSERGFVAKTAVVEPTVTMDNDSQVCDSAKVREQAELHQFAKVLGNAEVYGSAQLFDKASVEDSAKVFDVTRLFNTSHVFESAQVFGLFTDPFVGRTGSVVYGSVQPEFAPQIHGQATVSGSQIAGAMLIFGQSKIVDSEATWVGRIGGGAEIFRSIIRSSTDGQIEISGDTTKISFSLVTHVLGPTNIFGGSFNSQWIYEGNWTESLGSGVWCGCFMTRETDNLDFSSSCFDLGSRVFRGFSVVKQGCRNIADLSNNRFSDQVKYITGLGGGFGGPLP